MNDIANSWELWRYDDEKEWFQVGSSGTYVDICEEASTLARHSLNDSTANGSPDDRKEFPRYLEARNSVTGESKTLYSRR